MSPLSMDDSPLIVSVIIPCRNEKTHIESCIRSVLKQEVLRDDFEVIVVDGMSDDGTRDILKRLANENSRLKVVDNPRRITPVALNIGIREALDQNVAIMGAHALYAPNYLRTCIEILDEHPDVCCSGGPVVSLGKSAFGRATALAMSHPLGVGNAKHRFPYYEGYAEGAGFPVFRKETFDNVGLYDEDLIHNHDDEFNFRVALSGGKVFISPRARCAYYVRETPRQLFWQYFQYGSYKVDVLKKHRRFISLRHLVPAVFFFVDARLVCWGSWLAWLLAPNCDCTSDCNYAPNYLRTCIEILDEHPDVCCSGGPVVSLGKSAFGRATALAMSHPLGVGNAKHRFPYYEGYAEGAGFPVFRKETFDNVGLYDEDLIHNHDDEFNFRVALSGGKVFISPRARCAYYVRETPRQLFWQYFQYGSYKVDVLKKHRRFISLRHVVPAVFFSLMLVLVVGGLGLPGCWRLIAIVLPIAYAFVLFMAGLQVAAKQRDFLGLILPIPTVIMHFSYAAGFVWKVVVGKRKKYSVDID